MAYIWEVTQSGATYRQFVATTPHAGQRVLVHHLSYRQQRRQCLAAAFHPVTPQCHHNPGFHKSVTEDFGISKLPPLAANALLHPVQVGSADVQSTHRPECPLYLRDAETLTSQNSRRYCLHSADATDYTVPWTRTKFWDRTYCIAGSTVWKSLPESVRPADATSSFKQQLKAHF